jgi:uncharacterized damage-inducible protein DinB
MAAAPLGDRPHMPLVDALLPEFDREMATTRRLLERVPDDRLGWKPHGRSWTLGELAQHVAMLPMWGSVTMLQPEIDLSGDTRVEGARSRSELLTGFDAHVTATRQALVGRTDAELMAPWSLKRNGETLFTMPKAVVWRSFVMNHLIHHRGQLSLYLRMQDVPLPAMYGPSADEA